MAEFSKYKAFSVGRLFLHNNRTPDDNVNHSNEEIDNERTYLNYHLKKGTPKDVQNRLNEVFRMKRSDQSVLGEMIVTLPRDVRDGDERAFFRAVYDFFCNDLGEKNIINAVVHKDETTPHLHLDFIPVVKGANFKKDGNNNFHEAVNKWKEEHENEPFERLCCKDKIDRKYLATMHPRLSAWVEREIGYEVEILNGATVNGNKTVLQLKLEELKKVVEKYEVRKQSLEKELQAFTAFVRKCGFKEEDVGLTPLLQRIDDLENQNKVFNEIISRNRYAFTKSDLERIREKKFSNIQSAKVSYYNSSMANVDFEENAIIIIELPYENKRALPQQKMIDDDEDLHRQVKLVSASTNKILVRNSRTSNKIYLFLKTDNHKQTVENLMELRKYLNDIDTQNRRIYMERIESDEYNIAKNILEQLDVPSNYYMKHFSSEKDAREMDRLKNIKE